MIVVSGLLVVTAVLSVSAIRPSNASINLTAEQKDTTMVTPTSDNLPTDNAATPLQPIATPHDSAQSTAPTATSSPSSNSSSTTITVNGQTTHVDGNASYDSSYTDDSGSHVSISVHNSSTSTAPDTGEEEGSQ